MITFQEIRQFVLDNPGAVSILLALGLAIVGSIGVAIRHVLPVMRKTAIPDPEAARIVATLQEGHRSQLDDTVQREEALRVQIRLLSEAVQALSGERENPGASIGIDEVLALLAKGETSVAEAVFQGVKERRKAEGEEAHKEEAHKEAAAVARHIGELAFLHDTKQALAAYREAVDLDPDNADGWNRLGHLLRRTGDFESAEHAYGRVLSLGDRVDDKELIAIATGNLGNLYQTRGDLDRAEEMYQKSLALNETLGRKKGLASQYGNLGNLYAARGDLGRAEEMYGKSLALFREVGAAPKIKEVEEWLANLRRSE